MKLTPLQKKYLTSLLAQRRDGPSMGRTLGRAKLFCIAHLVLLAGAAFYIHEGGPWQLIGCGLAGLAVGSFFRLLRITFTAQRVWPMTTQIIDWEKAETLLRGNTGASTPGQPVK